MMQRIQENKRVVACKDLKNWVCTWCTLRLILTKVGMKGVLSDVFLNFELMNVASINVGAVGVCMVRTPPCPFIKAYHIYNSLLLPQKLWLAAVFCAISTCDCDKMYDVHLLMREHSDIFMCLLTCTDAMHCCVVKESALILMQTVPTHIQVAELKKKLIKNVRLCTAVLFLLCLAWQSSIALSWLFFYACRSLYNW